MERQLHGDIACPPPSPPTVPPIPTRHLYEAKPARYFANARHDMVACLPTGPCSAILEVGCGAGGTARAVRAAGKAGRYVGIELCPAAAAEAREAVDRLLIGDVETLDVEQAGNGFDALILSEVLEHLVDPWRTVRRLAALLRPGGLVLASSPNIAHWSIVASMLKGRFDYAASGVMDSTHLRWFTPASYRRLFEQGGFSVTHIAPVREPGWRGNLVNRLSGNRLQHLFMTQMMLTGLRRG